MNTKFAWKTQTRKVHDENVTHNMNYNNFNNILGISPKSTNTWRTFKTKAHNLRKDAKRTQTTEEHFFGTRYKIVLKDSVLSINNEWNRWIKIEKYSPNHEIILEHLNQVTKIMANISDIPHYHNTLSHRIYYFQSSSQTDFHIATNSNLLSNHSH